jgi:hypothetical protein
MIFLPYTSVGGEEDPPERQGVVNERYTEFEWLVINWTDYKVKCELSIDHEGPPSPLEILYGCGEKTYDRYLRTPPCKAKRTGSTEHCTGVFVHLVKSERRHREITIDLPQAEVLLDLKGCTYQPPVYHFDLLPQLLSRGIEPIPNEEIISI